MISVPLDAEPNTLCAIDATVRSISVKHHLWNTLEVLKKQTYVAAWAAHGLLDVEEFQSADIGRAKRDSGKVA